VKFRIHRIAFVSTQLVTFALISLLLDIHIISGITRCPVIPRLPDQAIIKQISSN